MTARNAASNQGARPPLDSAPGEGWKLAQMPKVYRVHEFAKRAGVTVKALRHYDRVGLLRPSRTPSGHRVYGERDLERLEQIVALKFLGLTLAQTKQLLERNAPSLHETLRLQRRRLEAQRLHLDRAIVAIREIDSTATSDTSNAAVLERLVQVLHMQNDLDFLQRYFDGEAWDAWTRRYPQWPSPEWRELYRDVQAALDEDPGGEIAAALAKRWVALYEADARLAPGIRGGWARAWTDRANWPASLRAQIAELGLEQVLTFITTAAWEMREKHLRQTAAPLAVPHRANASRIAFFRDVATMVHEDPAGAAARALLSRWDALLDAETGGDLESKAEMLKAYETRHAWPAGVRQYVASLYMMEPGTWESVVDYLDRARAAHARTH
jgi:MerR family transcriptional regulator, thiopeptide resistance regulator